MAARKLSDQEALDRLARASDALGVEEGATVPGNTALEAARRAVTMLLLGLEGAGEPPTRSPEPEPGSDSPGR